MLAEDDRKAFEDIQQTVLSSTEAASKALSDASSELDRMSEADAQNTIDLQANCEKFSKQLVVSEELCSALVSRHAEGEQELETSEIACAVADTAVQVLLDAHQSAKSKVDGALKDAVESCAAKLQIAKQAMVDVRKKGSVELEAARHTMGFLPSSGAEQPGTGKSFRGVSSVMATQVTRTGRRSTKWRRLEHGKTLQTR